MYLQDFLKEYNNQKIKLLVDMDGVIADYIFEDAKDYDKKRPLFTSIKKLEEVAKKPNIEMYIFSASRDNVGINQKNGWLDKYAPFFKKENRIIISREANNMMTSALLKAKYLENYMRDDSLIIVIDDDPRNLKEIRKYNDDIILLKDTALVD